MGEPAPLQPDLPFDLDGPSPSPAPPPEPSLTPGLPDLPTDSPPAAKSTEPPAAWRPAVVAERAFRRRPPRRVPLPVVPWSRLGSAAGRALGGGITAGTVGARVLGRWASGVGLVVVRGVPYLATLARNLARLGLFRGVLRVAAEAVHVLGFPAVVTRTAIQLTVVHRAGLDIESVTYFEPRDPAGYVVYQAPASLGTGVAVAFFPTLILWGLALVCLAPALTPRAILHLHYSVLTWAQVWLGMGLAAHALPANEEAGPLAAQARAGVAKADPLALLTVIPTQLVAWLTRFGGLLPAAAGIVVVLWAAGAIFH